MDFLGAVPFDKIFNGSGWALAFWTVLYVTRMVFKGDLVQRGIYQKTEEALTVERERNALLLRQLEKATDSMETFERFVQSLPQPVPAPRSGGRQRAQGKGRPADSHTAQWGEWDPPGGPDRSS